MPTCSFPMSRAALWLTLRLHGPSMTDFKKFILSILLSFVFEWTALSKHSMNAFHSVGRPLNLFISNFGNLARISTFEVAVAPCKSSQIGDLSLHFQLKYLGLRWSENWALSTRIRKFVKTQIFFYEYGLRPHVSGVFSGRIRKFLKTLSRVEIFLSDTNTYTCGRSIRKFLNTLTSLSWIQSSRRAL